MPDKNPIYRLDEELLRKKLLNYSVTPDPAECDAIEREVADLRIKKNISLPNVNWRKIVPAAAIVVLLALIGFNLQTISGWFSPAPEVKPVQEQTIVQPEEKISTPAPPATVTETASAVNTNTITTMPSDNVVKQVTKQPAVETAKKTDTVVSETATTKKPAPVLAQPPSDSAVKKVESRNIDTAVEKREAPVKKKKRRRRNANIDELKESTLQPSSADDDVVVPQ